MDELRQFLRLVWRWRWLLFAITVSAFIITFVVTQGLDRKYQVSVTLTVGHFLDEVPLSESGLRVGQELARNYAQLANQDGFLTKLINEKRWKITAEQLKEAVWVYPIQGSQMLAVSVTGTDYSKACQMADEFAAWLKDFNPSPNNTIDAKPLLSSEIEALEGEISETRDFAERLKTEISAGGDNVKVLRETLGSSEVRLKNIRNEYLRLLEKLNSSQRIQILNHAAGSTDPISPNLWLNIMTGVFGSLLFTILVIMLVEYTNKP